MTTQTINTINRKSNNIVLENIVKELEIVKKQLRKFILLIPEESIKEYKNLSQIKKDYLNARIERFPRGLTFVRYL